MSKEIKGIRNECCAKCLYNSILGTPSIYCLNTKCHCHLPHNDEKEECGHNAIESNMCEPYCRVCREELIRHGAEDFADRFEGVMQELAEEEKKICESSECDCKKYGAGVHLPPDTTPDINTVKCSCGQYYAMLDHLCYKWVGDFNRECGFIFSNGSLGQLNKEKVKSFIHSTLATEREKSYEEGYHAGLDSKYGEKMHSRLIGAVKILEQKRILKIVADYIKENRHKVERIDRYVLDDLLNNLK